MCLSFGQFAKIIPFPLLSTVGVIFIFLIVEFQNIWHFCSCIWTYVLPQRVPHSKIHSLFFCMFWVPAVWLWCMFQSLVQCMACLPVNACKNLPVCSDLWCALVLFLSDTVLMVEYWKLYYQIFIFVYAESNQLHIIVNVKSL